MADRLSALAQRAIAAWDGRVTVCQPAKHAIDLSVAVPRAEAKERAKRMGRAAARAERASQAAWAAAVRRGLTLDELAAEFGVEFDEAKRICRKFGLRPKILPRAMARTAIRARSGAAKPTARPWPATVASAPRLAEDRVLPGPLRKSACCRDADALPRGKSSAAQEAAAERAAGLPGARPGAPMSETPIPERREPTRAELRAYASGRIDARELARLTGLTAAELFVRRLRAGPRLERGAGL